eukprot:4577180-Pleurochrysis_carterae.AAC.1
MRQCPVLTASSPPLQHCTRIGVRVLELHARCAMPSPGIWGAGMRVCMQNVRGRFVNARHGGDSVPSRSIAAVWRSIVMVVGFTE